MGLIFQIFKQIPQINLKKQVDNPSEIWAKCFNNVFPEKKIQMALKSRKRCFTASIIKIMTIKAAKCHILSILLAMNKKN